MPDSSIATKTSETDEKPSLEVKADALLQWYQKEKKDFAASVYMSEGSDWSKLFRPYTNWDSSEVLKRERDFLVTALAKLSKHLASQEPTQLKREVSLLILALKNRTEFASQQADFYPVFGTVVAFAVGLASIDQGTGMKLMLGIAGLFFLATAFQSRIKTRQAVASLKELTNVLEYFKSELGR